MNHADPCRTLHDPTGDDARLFRLILEHYEDAYWRMIQLDACKPAYGLEWFAQRATELHEALSTLLAVVEEADRLVILLQNTVADASEAAAGASRVSQKPRMEQRKPLLCLRKRWHTNMRPMQY